jgi:hypothetical protein
MADEIRVTSVGETEVHRMAGETQDTVEGTLVIETREPTARGLDPLAAVREHPLRALGLVFGAGLALGLLTGGNGRRSADDEGDEDYEDGDEYEDEYEDEEEDEDEDEVDGDSTTDRVRSFISQHLSGLLTEAVQQLARRVTHK